MSSFWITEEEFKEFVHPVELDKSGQFKLYLLSSAFERQKELCLSVEELQRALEKLADMGFGNEEISGEVEQRDLEKVRKGIWDIARSGEEILLYHKRLALSEWSNDFLHEKDLDEHWERYAPTGRIFKELNQLIYASQKLLTGFYKFIDEDRNFVVNDVELPESLALDFVHARDLFSVGFEEIGLLVAGRGLEGILREIARIRGIKIKNKKGISEASEASFFDLIETFYRLKWEDGEVRFIDSSTKALLHFLRETRNSGAHPSINSSWGAARGIVLVVAKTGNLLWANGKKRESPIVEKVVQKNW